MKVLFLVGATSRIRNFHHTIMTLADQGHDVRLTGRLRKGIFTLPETVQHERISARVNPTERSDEWRDFADLLRGARDYVRYFDPRYAHATRLVRRAYQTAPTEFVLFCERHSAVKRYWKLASRVLALCEDLIPTDPGFEAFLREERPDVIVVTPLVTFEAYQTDYVKAAHRLGVPVVFIPFSWDNLTNKGLVRIQPDRVLVWNDVQRREAIELHGCRPDDVVVTGAARFDDFFAQTPSMSRAEFLGQFGLDPARPMVIYLGSSQLTGPNEMELIRRWAESLRAADDQVLRTCGILIRPHPALRTSWTSVDFSDLGPVAVSADYNRSDNQELFDGLYHAHAAVGLNTSALLEAAIIGRPVHTLVMPGFDEGQVGTIHFRYLVEAYGGLATIASDFPEHHRQLSAVLRGEPICSSKSRAFAEHFLRPHGIDRSVSPVLASEIERAAAIVKRPRSAAPVRHYPLRRALHRWLQQRTVTNRAAKDSTAVGSSMSLRPVKTALEELQHGTAPVFVGPWLDSIGTELLYWIPFVRWASAVYGLAPERLIVLSRGGVSRWYGPLSRRYLDAPTLFSYAELEHWRRRTVPQSEQNPKIAVMSPFDTEIIERASRAFELSDYQVFHPLSLFRVLFRLRQARTLDQLAQVLHHQPLDAAARRRVDGLPKSFVALGASFTDALPDGPENRALLTELLKQVPVKHEVVVVDTVPRHIDVPQSPRLHFLDSLVTAETRLEVLTNVLAQARAFIGSHGDLAILAASCGTPAVTYHSERLPVGQLESCQSASSSAGWGTLTVQRAHRFKGVRLPAKVHA